MITIHQFRRKKFLTEADAPAGGASPSGGAAPPGGALGGATPPPGGAPPSDLGGLGGSLGGSLGGATPPPPPSLGADLGGGIGAGATGGAPTAVITDINKLNAWDLLEKYFEGKIKRKDKLEPYT
jgi:hypothetical protein